MWFKKKEQKRYIHTITMYIKFKNGSQTDFNRTFYSKSYISSPNYYIYQDNNKNIQVAFGEEQYLYTDSFQIDYCYRNYEIKEDK